MQIKIPKSDKYEWTRHAQYKMQQYGLSPQRVVRVIRNPERVEEGIVPKTIAVMQPASIKFKDGKKTWSQEIWAMYQLRGSGAISKLQFPISKPQVVEQGSLRGRQISNLKFQKLQTTNQKLHPVKYCSAVATSALFHRVKIISAWRYPGVSPKNNPIPEEILNELAEMG